MFGKASRRPQGADHARGFVERLAVFVERFRVGDDATAHGELNPAVLERERTNKDAAVKVATGSEEEQASTVGTANGWFQRGNDFHRTNFGCTSD